jgi:uncharacterized membrane protein
MSRATVPSDFAIGRVPVIALLSGCCLIAYELLVHWAVVAQGNATLGPLLASVPLFLLALVILRRHTIAAVLGIGVLAALWLAVLGAKRLAPALSGFYPLSSVVVYGSLLWMFGRTLGPGQQPLATRLALRVHGTLPPEIERYTRQVTWAWTFFFAGTICTSVLLFAYASLSTWSIFANVLGIPLLVLMFVVEYAFRLWRFPDFPHVSLLATPRLFGDFRRRSASGQRGA